MNGASTNPDAHVVAYAAAQVKKGLDVAKKLGAENFGESPCGLNSCTYLESYNHWTGKQHSSAKNRHVVHF